MDTEAILLIDSDVRALHSLRRALDGAAFDVLPAASTEDARALLREHPAAVAVIVLDHARTHDPGFGGWLAQEHPSTECVLVVRGPHRDLNPLYAPGNVFSHVPYPQSDASELARAIARAAERRALRRQNTALLTQLRDARDELRTQGEFLVQVERLAAVGSLARDCADTLRDTLHEVGSVVAREVELRQAQPAREGGRPGLADAGEAIARCVHLTEGIADFAHGSREPTQRVPVTDLLDEALELLRPCMVRSRINVLLDLPHPSPAVIADAGRLRQAFVHVMLNAIQSMPDGGFLSVAATGAPNGEDSVRVRIADTGAGISPEVLPHIFEPFYTTRPLGHGTGLGLAITRSIVREHDGAIEVECSRGRGATFTIALPGVQAHPLPEAADRHLMAA